MRALLSGNSTDEEPQRPHPGRHLRPIGIPFDALSELNKDESCQAAVSTCTAIVEAEWKGNRVLIPKAIDGNTQRLAFLEKLVDRLASAINVKPIMPGTT